MILANGFFKSDYFDLKLTPEQQDEVFGTLLEYGPVYPNRIV